jgi:hypothetical protein
VESADAWRGEVDEVLRAPGPLFVSVAMKAGVEKPLRRAPSEEARYLKTSLAESSRAMRRALTGERR